MWRLLLLSLCASLMLLSTPAAARWIEADGDAAIANGDVNAARERALENAVQQALMLSGGNISSVQSVVDGVLQNSATEWRGQGSVDQVEIIREEINGDRLFVTIRADIWNRDSSCPTQTYKKSVTVVPFEITERSQAVYGEVYRLGEASARKFTEQLGSRGQHMMVKHTLMRDVGLNKALHQVNLQNLGELARVIGRKNDSQYVIFGAFTDLSVYNDNTGVVSSALSYFSNASYDRNYALTLYLMDAYSGEIITRAAVSDAAPWDFDNKPQVDVAADYFWTSPFGNSLLASLQELAQGLDNQLRCAPARGRIVRVANQELQINLGSVNGVQVGDRLRVVHEANFIDSSDAYRQKWEASEFVVEVTQVNQTSAIARLGNDTYLSNVQINDWVVPADAMQ